VASPPRQDGKPIGSPRFNFWPPGRADGCNMQIEQIPAGLFLPSPSRSSITSGFRTDNHPISHRHHDGCRIAAFDWRPKSSADQAGGGSSPPGMRTARKLQVSPSANGKPRSAAEDYRDVRLVHIRGKWVAEQGRNVRIRPVARVYSTWRICENSIGTRLASRLPGSGRSRLPSGMVEFGEAAAAPAIITDIQDVGCPDELQVKAA